MKRCWQEGRQAEKQANRHRDRHHTFRSTFMLNMVPIPVTAFYIELPHNHWQASATSNLGMKINFYENCKIWKNRWGSGVFDFSLLPPLPQFFFKEFTINIRMFSPPKKNIFNGNPDNFHARKSFWCTCPFMSASPIPWGQKKVLKNIFRFK